MSNRIQNVITECVGDVILAKNKSETKDAFFCSNEKKEKNRQNYGHCKVFSAFNIPLIFERWQHLRKDLLVLWMSAVITSPNIVSGDVFSNP